MITVDNSLRFPLTIEAVLFDLDGVLIDSSEANFVFYRRVLSELGYCQPSDEECTSVFHMTMIEALRVLSREVSGAKLDRLRERAMSYSFPSELMRVPTGAQECIDALSCRNLLGIVTNGTRAAVEDFFEMFGRQSKFDVTIAFEDVDNHKPEPEPLRRACYALGVAPQNTMYVGDSRSDVVAAHSAGMPAVTIAPCNQIGADACVETFAHLVELMSDPTVNTRGP